MRALITGITGFAGSHLADYLLAEQPEVEIFGIRRWRSRMENIEHLDGKIQLRECDLRDAAAVQGVLTEIRPNYIFHLAAQSSVGESWQRPACTFFNNSNIFLNLLEAIRQSGDVGSCRLLSVGSSEQYGSSLPRSSGYVETDPQIPTSPYAVARSAQEQLARVYVDGFGLDIVCTRSFNHIGPGQSDRFVVSALARRCVEVAQGRLAQVSCGNLAVVRDFVDVRDVCRAYMHVLDRGAAGEVYNVCSGRGRQLRSLLSRFAEILKIDPTIAVDQSLMRPLDNPVVIGNPQKLQHLGWQARYSFEDTLSDVIEDWKRRIGGPAGEGLVKAETLRR